MPGAVRRARVVHGLAALFVADRVQALPVASRAMGLAGLADGMIGFDSLGREIPWRSWRAAKGLDGQ